MPLFKISTAFSSTGMKTQRLGVLQPPLSLAPNAVSLELFQFSKGSLVQPLGSGAYSFSPAKTFLSHSFLWILVPSLQLTLKCHFSRLWHGLSFSEPKCPLTSKLCQILTSLLPCPHQPHSGPLSYPNPFVAHALLQS